jgi:hypothetical protein
LSDLPFTFAHMSVVSVLPLRRGALLTAVLLTGACARQTTVVSSSAIGPNPDPRVGLKPGYANAGEAAWNLKRLATVNPPERFKKAMNSDLAFTGKYAIQGNFNGFQVWDMSTPSAPVLVTEYYCPASQSDVSVYRNLLFVSGEGFGGRVDCGGQGVPSAVSKDRLRGIRIFDITDITRPKYIHNVQTCRGSHTHTVVEDPNDKENIYVYVSGSAPVRSAQELDGCVNAPVDSDPNSSLFRIEVIQVPLANPAQAKIVSSPRFFQNLAPPPSHGEPKSDLEEARKRGDYIVKVQGQEMIVPAGFTKPMMDSVMKARNGTGTPTAADTAAVQATLEALVKRMTGDQAPSGPNQCHDITVYPAVGLAGGACEGYGLLLDIRNPKAPVRIAAVSDSNFAYWHSATFNNDGTKVLFTDEWGGGGAPKCRASDPKEWGANAIFTIENGRMVFQSYYKLSAPQTELENCVAHNGSLIPIPGRDVMVQSWYQGGISIFDWTDAKKPVEIAFHDRGPVDSTTMGDGGSWSVYWYNGSIVSSEIGRGLDVFDLTPSAYLSQNEIDAAKTVRWDYLNAQGQPKIVWPPSFALARAYADQLERNKCLSSARLSAVRSTLSAAEKAAPAQRRDGLTRLSQQLDTDAASSCDGARVRKLSEAARALASITA